MHVIKVDDDLCQGHGVCESEAPQLFEVGKDRKVHVLNPNPTAEDMKQLQLAIKYCPTRALSVVSTDEDDNSTNSIEGNSNDN